MTISFQPDYRPQARELKRFLKKNNLTQDINYIIGGDGALLIYASKIKPNVLISPDSSVGYYAFTRLGNHHEAILEYLDNPSKFNIEYPTIESKINGIKLDDFAINDVLITEGLQYLSKISMTIGDTESFESNSGLLVYTHDGWSGFAKNLEAKKYGLNELGLTSIAPSKGELSKIKSLALTDELSIKILPRNRKTKFAMYVDCKDVKPYKHFCTDIKKVYIKPYKIKQNDEITIMKGKPIIIALVKDNIY
ncbi:MAG: hypothetical protein WC393_00630 [Candidatus Nanoarchaeia archaeon]|jgi:NAD kinase